MTPAQEVAFRQIRSILTEHFDAHVLALRYDCEDGTPHAIDFQWNARLSEAVGLTHMLKHKLDQRIQESSRNDQTEA